MGWKKLYKEDFDEKDWELVLECVAVINDGYLERKKQEWLFEKKMMIWGGEKKFRGSYLRDVILYGNPIQHLKKRIRREK